MLKILLTSLFAVLLLNSVSEMVTVIVCVRLAGYRYHPDPPLVGDIGWTCSTRPTHTCHARE